MITKTYKKMKKSQKSKEASLSMDKFNQVFFHVSLKPRKMIKKKSQRSKEPLLSMEKSDRVCFNALLKPQKKNVKNPTIRRNFIFNRENLVKFVLTYY